MPTEPRNRAYIRARLTEELDRAQRYDRPFTVVCFEALPGNDGIRPQVKVEQGLKAIAQMLRPSDVAALLHDDAICVLLIETDVRGAKDATIRLRNVLSRVAGAWQMEAYVFPADVPQIEALALAA